MTFQEESVQGSRASITRILKPWNYVFPSVLPQLRVPLVMTFRWRSFRLKPCRPVLHENQRRLVFFRRGTHDESLTVRRYVITVSKWICRCDEEPLAAACVEAGSFSIHLHGHDCVVGAQIKEFLTVPAPSWNATAVIRNLPFATGSARRACASQKPGTVERHYIHFPSPRFPGAISHPSPIGRELPVTSCRRRMQKECRLFLAG
jgi:hypothetical protein